MNLLVLNHLNTKRNLLIFSSLVLIVILSTYLPIPKEEGQAILYFYSYELKENYNSVLFQLLSFITPLLTLLIVIDHDQAYLNNLSTYKGRFYVVVNKLIVYITLILIIFLILINVILLTLIVSKNSYLYSNDFITNILILFLDNIILLFLILITTSISNKNISYIIILVYYMRLLLSNESFDEIIFYIIPFLKISKYKLINVVLYKISYIIVLSLVKVNLYIFENFNKR